MGIYLPNMEMPTSCDNCELCACYVLEDGTEENYRCPITMYPIHNFDERLDNCPLVPVPPHGRLIEEQWLKDAMITTLEALKKNPKMDRQEMHLIAAFYTLRAMVEDAPTIIEAEEGE